MPKLSDILKRPLGMFRSAEAQLPRGMPKISQVLSNIADALPPLPDLPNFGGRGGKGFQLPRTAGVFRSVEEWLPSQAPKVSQLVEKLENPLAPREEVAPAPQKPPALIFE